MAVVLGDYAALGKQGVDILSDFLISVGHRSYERDPKTCYYHNRGGKSEYSTNVLL
jgi:hypothetical protein